MKKTAIILAAILLVAVSFGSASATAIIAFSGNVTTSDTGGVAGFYETMTFSTIFSAGSGTVSSTQPADAIFDDAGLEYVVIASLTLSETSFVNGVYYDFAPTLYVSGFEVYDDNGTRLFYADLTVDQLVIQGTSGDINPSFTMNLTNITADGSYVAGTSAIVDEFVGAPGGAMQVSIQLGSLPLPDEGAARNTYSGTAEPVPEPSTVLMLGAGLIGLAVIGRKKFIG